MCESGGTGRRAGLRNLKTKFKGHGEVAEFKVISPFSFGFFCNRIFGFVGCFLAFFGRRGYKMVTVFLPQGVRDLPMFFIEMICCEPKSTIRNRYCAVASRANCLVVLAKRFQAVVDNIFR